MKPKKSRPSQTDILSMVRNARLADDIKNVSGAIVGFEGERPRYLLAKALATFAEREGPKRSHFKEDGGFVSYEELIQRIVSSAYFGESDRRFRVKAPSHFGVIGSRISF